jgi:hypothetical protein
MPRSRITGFVLGIFSIATTATLIHAATPTVEVSFPDDLAAFSQAAKTFGINLSSETPKESAAEIRSSEFNSPVKLIRKITSKQFEVAIDVKSGKIVSAYNEALFLEEDARLTTFNDTGKMQEPKQNLKQVVEATEKLVAALGQELGPDLKLSFVRFDSKRGCWELSWFRYIRGFLFEEECVSLTMDDAALKAVCYGDTVTEITCSTEVKITRDKAKASAMSRVSTTLQYDASNETFRADEVDPPQLWIVYANDNVAANKLPSTPTDQYPRPKAHLAYVFHFKFVYAGKSHAHAIIPPAYVFVDAASGAVIGGI